MKKRKPLVLLFGDNHAGGFTAMCPPKFKLDDGGWYHASPVQSAIHGFWKNAINHVMTSGRDIIVTHMADAVDGVVKHSVQSISNIADQERLAIEILKPIVQHKAVKRFIMLRGTEAHVGKSAASEVRIADNLCVELYWKFWLDVQGVTFDLAHHGQGGQSLWSSNAAKTVANVILNCANDSLSNSVKLEIPRYIVRAHTHKIDDSGSKNPHCRAFTTPALQAANAYSYRVNSIGRADIGIVVVDTENDNDVRFITYSAPLDRIIVKV